MIITKVSKQRFSSLLGVWLAQWALPEFFFLHTESESSWAINKSDDGDCRSFCLESFTCMCESAWLVGCKCSFRPLSTHISYTSHNYTCILFPFDLHTHRHSDSLFCSLGIGANKEITLYLIIRYFEKLSPSPSFVILYGNIFQLRLMLRD